MSFGAAMASMLIEQNSQDNVSGALQKIENFLDNVKKNQNKLPNEQQNVTSELQRQNQVLRYYDSRSMPVPVAQNTTNIGQRPGANSQNIIELVQQTLVNILDNPNQQNPKPVQPSAYDLQQKFELKRQQNLSQYGYLQGIPHPTQNHQQAPSAPQQKLIFYKDYSSQHEFASRNGRDMRKPVQPIPPPMMRSLPMQIPQQDAYQRVRKQENRYSNISAASSTMFEIRKDPKQRNSHSDMKSSREQLQIGNQRQLPTDGLDASFESKNDQFNKKNSSLKSATNRNRVYSDKSCQQKSFSNSRSSQGESWNRYPSYDSHPSYSANEQHETRKDKTKKKSKHPKSKKSSGRDTEVESKEKSELNFKNWSQKDFDFAFKALSELKNGRKEKRKEVTAPIQETVVAANQPVVPEALPASIAVPTPVVQVKQSIPGPTINSSNMYQENQTSQNNQDIVASEYNIFYANNPSTNMGNSDYCPQNYQQLYGNYNNTEMTPNFCSNNSQKLAPPINVPNCGIPYQGGQSRQPNFCAPQPQFVQRAFPYT